jgi:MoxR-like ATPase
LLAALRAGDGAVLLVDELDRADDEFEAFLLEVLSEFAVTVPEVGRIAADRPPAVIITSNRTRELHDALKRRCLYHWIDHPTLDREVEIIRVRAPEVPESLATQVAGAVARIRQLDVAKRPGVAEAIDWAHALAFIGVDTLNGEAAEATLGAVLKDHEDLDVARASMAKVLDPTS